ncbi:hypothetical protein [Bilophila wadsworthia]|uniref:hypothetical protein n=1 Tax=Bilophila wadsworthia TaxID=35833 RepID=UPI003C6D6375
MPINKRRAQRISAPAFPNELLHDFKVPHVHFIGAPLLLVIHLARQPHPRLRGYPIGTKDPLADFYRYLSGIILKYILVFAEAFQNIPFQRAGGIIKGILYLRRFRNGLRAGASESASTGIRSLPAKAGTAKAKESSKAMM